MTSPRAIAVSHFSRQNAIAIEVDKIIVLLQVVAYEAFARTGLAEEEVYKWGSALRG